jgi:hypothetical protein
MAIAIENALVFQEVSGVRDPLRLLLNLTSRITSTREEPFAFAQAEFRIFQPPEAALELSDRSRW